MSKYRKQMLQIMQGRKGEDAEPVLKVHQANSVVRWGRKRERGTCSLFLACFQETTFSLHGMSLLQNTFSETLVSLVFSSLFFSQHKSCDMSQRTLKSISLLWPAQRLVVCTLDGAFHALSHNGFVVTLEKLTHQSCSCYCSVVVTKEEEPPKSLLAATCLGLKKSSFPLAFYSV